MVIEDDEDALKELIDYCDVLANDPTTVGPDGEFHAAKPHDDYLNTGDWYLTKSHGVSVSHRLERDGWDD